MYLGHEGERRPEGSVLTMLKKVPGVSLNNADAIL